MSQAPELSSDVLPHGGLGAGEFDESDGGLVLVLVPGLYHFPRDSVLGKAAGWQTASLTSDGGQLVITRGRELSLPVSGGGRFTSVCCKSSQTGAVGPQWSRWDVLGLTESPREDDILPWC